MVSGENKMGNFKDEGFIDFTGSMRYVIRDDSEKILQQQFKRTVYKDGRTYLIQLFWKDVETFKVSEVENVKSVG